MHPARRVSQAGVDLGAKPDGNRAKLWPAVSQPPEKRRRAALAGKVKRLIIEAGGSSNVGQIEPEWAAGTVWFNGHRVASATTMQPPGATASTVARALRIQQSEVEETWGPLRAAL